ncbi:uncharacterized protein G2W53_013653 [Senna tora]|uniref:Uncharacterized protein n=1 Tax=Senna tora TaxID=362788 RepID=A0A834WPL3_9FABA|nr:uncharacterized protein G2W53_013653 [Senna tora]
MASGHLIIETDSMEAFGVIMSGAENHPVMEPVVNRIR